MKTLGLMMIAIGAASFAWPALKPGTQLVILTPFGDKATIVGGVIGVVGLLVLLIGVVKGKPKKK